MHQQGFLQILVLKRLSFSSTFKPLAHNQPINLMDRFLWSFLCACMLPGRLILTESPNDLILLAPPPGQNSDNNIAYFAFTFLQILLFLTPPGLQLLKSLFTCFISDQSVDSRLQVKMNSPDSARDISIKQEEPEDHPHFSKFNHLNPSIAMHGMKIVDLQAHNLSTIMF